MSWVEIDPLPTRFWIRWAPRRTPATALPFLDLGTRRIVWPSEEAAPRDLPGALPPDIELALLPPVPVGLRAQRLELMRHLERRGFPIVTQEIAGGREMDDEGSHPLVLDLLSLMLDGAAGRDRLTAWKRPPRRLWVAFPLVPGVAPTVEETAEWLRALVPFEPAAVVGVAPELDPLDRRRLLARVGEDRFEAVFHSRPRSEVELASAAGMLGLPVLPARPELPGLAPRVARNRCLAATLAEAGDLQIRLGGSEVEAVDLLAAARHLERTTLDVAALAREGNLALLDWLSPTARKAVEEASHGAWPVLRELRQRWRGAQA